MDPSVEEKVLAPKEDNPEDLDLIHLSSGVVLRGKQMNPLILIDIMSRFHRPEPPMKFIEKMGRQIEDPEDPDYLKRVNAYELEMSTAILPAMISYGTEIVSMPKGFSGPHPTIVKDVEIPPTWLEEYEMLNLPMKPLNASWRYLKWVMFKAVQNTDDMTCIQEVVGRLNGIRESAVKAAENFPRR